MADFKLMHDVCSGAFVAVFRAEGVSGNRRQGYFDFPSSDSMNPNKIAISGVRVCTHLQINIFEVV